MLQEICVNVSVVDDSSFEDAEQFSVSLRVSQAVRSAVSVHIGQTTITILDDDQVSIALTAQNRTLPESVGVVEACVQLTGQTEKTIPYQFQVIPLEGELTKCRVQSTKSKNAVVTVLFPLAAVSGVDYHFTADAQNQFNPSSEPSQTHCHSITIVGDSILEDTEQLEAILTGPVGVARLSVGVDRMRVAIIDDDTVTVGFTRTEFIVDEDGELEDRSLDVCVQLVGETEREVSVSVASQQGTADGKRALCSRGMESFTCKSFSLSSWRL